MMAAFSVFLIKERVSKAKHLQFLSGAQGLNFWLTTFLWHAVHYIICVLLIYVAWIIAYQSTSLKEDLAAFLDTSRIGYSILLYTLYAFSHIPMTYLMTYMFQIPASGFAWITIINIITSETISSHY